MAKSKADKPAKQPKTIKVSTLALGVTVLVAMVLKLLSRYIVHK